MSSQNQRFLTLSPLLVIFLQSKIDNFCTNAFFEASFNAVFVKKALEIINSKKIFTDASRGFTKFGIKVLWRLQFLEYLRTLSLKFQKAWIKLKLSWVCPVGCLSLADPANRADSGQLQFWSEPSEILDVRFSSTVETVALTIPWYQTWWNP